MAKGETHHAKTMGKDGRPRGALSFLFFFLMGLGSDVMTLCPTGQEIILGK